MRLLLSAIVILTSVTTIKTSNADILTSTSSLVATPVSDICNKTSSKSIAEYQVASTEFDKEQFKEAEDFINDLSTKAVTGIFSQSIVEAKKEALFHELFSTSVDLDALGRFVLGRYWKAATHQEKQKFLQVFSNLTIKTWARRFNGYAGISVKTTGVVPSKNKGQLFVESKILQGEGKDPIIVRWRVIKKQDGYKVIDIIVEGSSMARTYRNEYRSVIKNSGKGVQGLIDILQSKLNEFENPESKATASDEKSVKIKTSKKDS
ncbi:MAG: ABC transporter substrate-binding protein [Alphaproteobacteria bacterium]|nr:ABC transporter substrate-binding protein [Alphaproteobacteria bacterium]